MRKLVLAGAIAILAMGSTACATKKFVRGEVENVNNRVETLSQSMEETQEQTRQHAARISEVDAKAGAAGQSAQEARAAADKVNTRVDDVERASKRLVYEVTLSEDQGNFKFGKTILPDEAKTEIDRLAQDLKTNPQGAFIEIEGHTDSVGPATVNERIGLERAEEVKRYLYESHQIPLHRINVISYGEDKPVAPNKTRDGRAQNRRVVIRILT